MNAFRHFTLLAALGASAAHAAPTVSVVATFRIEGERTTPLAVNETGAVAGYRAYTATAGTGRNRPAKQGWSAFLTAADGA